MKNIFENVSFPAVLCGLLLLALTILCNEYTFIFIQGLQVPTILQISIGVAMFIAINIVCIGAALITILDW